MTAPTTGTALDTGASWVEYGVRRTWGDVGSVAYFERDYQTARKCAKDWPGVLVSRRVVAEPWADLAALATDTTTEDS